MRLEDIVRGNVEQLPAEDGEPQHFYAYIRVSTEDQDRKGLSLPAQKRLIEEYSEKNGIVIIGLYADVESAHSKYGSLQDLARMMNDIKRNPDIAGVLVHDYSRMHRDSPQCVIAKAELRQRGLRLVSATEPEYDRDTLQGLMLDKMTELKNASYSMEVAKHTKKGMSENIARRDPEIGYCYKNGGSPLWGYRAFRVHRGINRRGEPIQKTLWELNKTLVVGRPQWQWVRHVLIELRLNQRASLDAIRDFLNMHGIPARRKKHWGISSVYSLLQPHSLLQFAGYGVWNVHKKNGKKRRSSEWITVENAHPAIIDLEEAQAIMEVNELQSRRFHDKSGGRMSAVRSKGSRYMLSGGLFVCTRCGENMTSYTNSHRCYYMCGSSVYRKGLGCGPGLQVSKEEIEGAVINEVGRMFKRCSNPDRLKKLINAEMKSSMKQETNRDAALNLELERIEREINNVRDAIRDGLDDIKWANSELKRLKNEKEEAASKRKQTTPQSIPMQVDPAAVERFQEAFAEVLATGSNEEKREFIRLFVKKIELNPDSGDILIRLLSRPPGLPFRDTRTPASKETGVQIDLVAGAGFEPATFGL